MINFLSEKKLEKENQIKKKVYIKINKLIKKIMILWK